MRSFVGQVFLVLAIPLYVYVCAQNDTHSVEVSSTETSRSCTHNVTGRDYVCEEVQNTTEVMPSEVGKDSDDVNVTVEVVDVESTLSPEVIYSGNETETELPVNITSVKSDIPTTQQQPNSTMKPISAATEMVKEARPFSSDICTCDLNVSMHIASIE